MKWADWLKFCPSLLTTFSCVTGNYRIPSGKNISSFESIQVWGQFSISFKEVNRLPVKSCFILWNNQYSEAATSVEYGRCGKLSWFTTSKYFEQLLWREADHFHAEELLYYVTPHDPVIFLVMQVSNELIEVCITFLEWNHQVIAARSTQRPFSPTGYTVYPPTHEFSSLVWMPNSKATICRANHSFFSLANIVDDLLLFISQYPM